jgi:hypothetical protein
MESAMEYDNRAWAPVVAERETSNRQPATPFPCRGDFNRYTGCIGARKCRGLGVTQCILGRWPDERQFGATLSRGLAEEPTAPLSPEIERPERRPRVTPPAAPGVAPVKAGPTARPTVGIVHGDRQVGQALARQVGGAGYEAILFTTAEAAEPMLAEATRPAALLVDGKLLQGDPAGERLLNTAAAGETPVLSLPPTLRGQASAEPAMRMATLWLAITLRGGATASRVG